MIKKIGFPKQQHQGQTNLGQNQNMYIFFSDLYNLLTNTELHINRINFPPKQTNNQKTHPSTPHIIVFKKYLRYSQDKFVLCRINVQVMKEVFFNVLACFFSPGD